MFVEVETGTAQEVVPPAPEGAKVTTVAAPGSRHAIYLPGNRRPLMTLEEAALKVINSGSSWVEFIVPQGLQDGTHTLEVSYDGSPFQPAELPITIRDFAPGFRYWGAIPQVWHDSDGTAVWEASPARSGEVIEVLLSGLGEVDAEGKTLRGMKWELFYSERGDAPAPEVLESRRSRYEDEEGLYRVKLRMPQVVRAGRANLLCSDPRDGDVNTGSSLLFVTP